MSHTPSTLTTPRAAAATRRAQRLGPDLRVLRSAVAALDGTQRATICNMIVELGATTAVFPLDERTREWLADQQRPHDYVALAADEDATYDEYELIELDTLEPLIAKPSSPGNVVPVREVAGTPVAQVCVGSSVNSGYADLAIVATAHKIARIVYHLLKTGEPYREEGAAEYEQKHQARELKHLAWRAQKLGYSLAPNPATALGSQPQGRG